MLYGALGYVKKNWALVIIILLGSFFRFYKIDEYLTFLGDEGRDAMIVRNLIVHLDPILIGPGTSVGNMYLGPLYYYYMAPFLLLSNFSPIGPAVGVALLGVLTIYLVYHVGKEWFGEKVGLIASLFFAISPTVVVYSRSSWNPNIMPFFALLSIYSIWKVCERRKYIWLLVAAISFAFVLQSHYLGLLLGPVLTIYWIVSRAPKRYTLFSIIIFIFLMSPIVLFDLRHDYLNTKALYKFLTVREETVSINPLLALPKSYPIFEQINSSLLTAKDLQIGKMFSLAMVLFLTYEFIRSRKVFFKKYALISLWLVVGLTGFGIYKQNIYDHYFGFLFPVPFLLLGIILAKIYESKYKILAIITFCFLIFVNLKNNTLTKEPNNQMLRAMAVSQKIIDESKGERYNIAVIAETNYEDGYQYFLEKENSKIVEIDPQIKDSVTNQLFVICEVNGSTLTEDTCKPVNSAKAQIASFGWSKVENMWEVGGVILYKLGHNNQTAK